MVDPVSVVKQIETIFYLLVYFILFIVFQEKCDIVGTTQHAISRKLDSAWETGRLNQTVPCLYPAMYGIQRVNKHSLLLFSLQYGNRDANTL